VAEVTTSLVKKKKDRQFWWDKIDRSTVKRCVMTTPYGVTEYGMKDQLIEYFQKKRDKGMVLPKVLHKDCIYLAKQIQRAIKRTLRGSIVIKEWLQDNAQHFPEGWMWHTPTGFKVINNPKRYKAKVITTKFLSQIWMRQAGTKGTIDTRRMRNTISPNFVHSMDAAHMGLTVLGMWTEGIRDFSMIHDSFGCHSCYVETMHRVIREQFVQMYAQKDWLAYMRDKVVKQIEKEGGKEEVEVIEQGELDLKEVLTSKYFFS
jgi:DNA-directed RNA polymerase